MLGFDDLLLANLLAKRAVVPLSDLRAALEAADREPGKVDLYARLAARGGLLARPEVREKALAHVRTHLFAKAEAAFAARLRASGAVPPAALDAAMAEQRQAGFTWSLADKLARDGLVTPGGCQTAKTEAAVELQKQEQQLVARHRTSRFSETLGVGGPLVGKQTAQFAASLEAPPDVLVQLAQQAASPPAADAGDEGERTVILPNGGLSAAPRPDVAAPPAGAGVLAPGTTLAGKYHVVSELGRGGMGIVFRAKASERNGEEIALKAVSLSKGKGDEVVQRFRREILTASLVDHENVCAVYDAGEADGHAFMAMELIEGETLKDLVAREGALEVPRALALIEQVLRGIQACHGVKVIHRDLKPENVRVTRKGDREVCKIVDFGIARLINQDPVIAERVFMTVKGTLSGTPAYVAPELVMEPDLVDERCDVYAIGVIFYELLTGKLPFASKTVRGLLRDTIEARPISLSDARPGHAISPEVERFLFRMMEKDTEVRYPTTDAALAALAEARVPAKPPEPPARPGFFARLFGGLFGR